MDQSINLSCRLRYVIVTLTVCKGKHLVVPIVHTRALLTLSLQYSYPTLALPVRFVVTNAHVDGT